MGKSFEGVQETRRDSVSLRKNLAGGSAHRRFRRETNAKLAQRFKVKTKTYDYPQYRLFLREKGLDHAIEYKGNNEAEDITKFIILTTGTWLQLPGCVAAYDELIKDFLNKTKDEREKIIE